MKEKKSSIAGVIVISILGCAIFPEIFIIPCVMLILAIILSTIKRAKSSSTNSAYLNNVTEQSTVEGNITLKCNKCGSLLKTNDKVCSNCGEPVAHDNVSLDNSDNIVVKPINFDPIFSLSESEMIDNFIRNEMGRAKIDENAKLIPKDVLKRKRVFNVVFSVLLFIYISLIFFHFPILTYVIGAFILFILFRITRKFTLIKYIQKQLKSRPGEKISNIIMSIKSSFVEDKTKKQFLIFNIIAIIVPLIIFINPIILYENDTKNNGYAVRFYAFGLTNFTTATIPETHNNQSVVSLRGNTFSNMPFLKEVELPNTIVEIRGQAFKNDLKLKKVNIPTGLNYLGGGAFYNCLSIESIELPDTLSYIGGESFKNAKSLVYINLPSRLTEVRGNTFENCSSLNKINIPDSVTRIGGHAFYGNSLLSEVTISPDSKLQEIGSSAFRRCDNLMSITLPRSIYINERAFKESPTQVYYYATNDNGYDKWWLNEQ